MEGAQQDSPARFIWQRGGTNSLESQYKILTARIWGEGRVKKEGKRGLGSEFGEF